MQTDARSPDGRELSGEARPDPADGTADGHAPSESSSNPEPVAATIVQFSISQVSFEWNDVYDSLLELAEDQNIDISGGCRYGDCGTCLTELLEGEVTYNHATGVRPDAGYCLPCSCRPLTSITLKA